VNKYYTMISDAETTSGRYVKWLSGDAEILFDCVRATPTIGLREEIEWPAVNKAFDLACPNAARYAEWRRKQKWYQRHAEAKRWRDAAARKTGDEGVENSTRRFCSSEALNASDKLDSIKSKIRAITAENDDDDEDSTFINATDEDENHAEDGKDHGANENHAKVGHDENYAEYGNNKDYAEDGDYHGDDDDNNEHALSTRSESMNNAAGMFDNNSSKIG
jgi:hypothetical protein